MDEKSLNSGNNSQGKVAHSMSPVIILLRRMLRLASVVLLAALLILIALGLRAEMSGPELERWHTFTPQELSAAEIDAADWGDYLDQEQEITDQVRDVFTDQGTHSDRDLLNRFAANSIVNPGEMTYDWNRSYILRPHGTAHGVVVLLHGLTDSPYSLRHLAVHFRDLGLVTIGIRMPGHGTVPAGLTRVGWQQWLAATRLAVREASRLRPDGTPLYVVGYSNGAALALMYALEADGSREQPRPDRLVLLSPMIGVNSYARFAGIAGLPAVLPAFAKSAWIDVLPEFNPFKYNSFPVHAARESYRLTMALHALLSQPERTATLPAVLAFQSVMDGTVTASAVVTDLFGHLPENGSELVLFDVNRAAYFERLLSPSAGAALERLLPQGMLHYTLSVVTMENSPGGETVLRSRPPGSITESVAALDSRYPADMYSLSHVAIPFPMSDSLYGRYPDHPDEFGLSLGTVAPRGERGVLLISLDSLLRASSNPFFDFMKQHIDEAFSEGSPSPANL